MSFWGWRVHTIWLGVAIWTLYFEIQNVCRCSIVHDNLTPSDICLFLITGLLFNARSFICFARFPSVSSSLFNHVVAILDLNVVTLLTRTIRIRLDFMDKVVSQCFVRELLCYRFELLFIIFFVLCSLLFTLRRQGRIAISDQSQS